MQFLGNDLPKLLNFHNFIQHFTGLSFIFYFYRKNGGKLYVTKHQKTTFDGVVWIVGFKLYWFYKCTRSIEADKHLPSSAYCSPPFTNQMHQRLKHKSQDQGNARH